MIIGLTLSSLLLSACDPASLSSRTELLDGSTSPSDDAGTITPKDGDTREDAGMIPRDAGARADSALPMFMEDAGPPPIVVDPDALALTTSALSSSSVNVAWPAIAGASAIRVSMSAEPGATRHGALPDAIEVAVLAGDAMSTRITALSPLTHVFIHVEADTSDGLVSGNTHVRTLGGPRVVLDTPVREVSLVAPNMLRIVLANGNGDTWAAASGWHITRRDGRALPVTNVSRDSLPVRQMGYDIGYGGDDDLSQIEADHRIYLELSEAVGTREVLHITGADGVDFQLLYSDRYLETPVIQLNQVGYNPRATKRYAYISMWMGTRGGLSLAAFPSTAEAIAESNDVLLPRELSVGALPVSERSANDSDTGAAVRQIDLASVPAREGVRLHLRVAGVGVSYGTEVSEEAARRAYYVVTRGLLHNRSGIALDETVTAYPRALDHASVFTGEQVNPFEFNPESTPRTGTRPLRGGYHDAGDFDQRPMHTVIPQVLMRAYESDPSRFVDSDLDLPESGNGIPDLLDEALWGIAAWEQLQEADGGVRSGAESWRHPWGVYESSDDPLPYWTYARDPNVSARAAGLFAQAARLLTSLDPTRATALRERAVRAYDYARAHDAHESFVLYGASELFRLTESARYKVDFEAAWSSVGPYGAFSNLALSHNLQHDYMGYEDAQIMPDYILSYMRTPGASVDILETTHTWFTRLAADVVDRVLDSGHAHRTARPNGAAPGWGQGTVMGRYLDPIIARLALGDVSASDRQRYFDAMSVAGDYVLGANPLGMVFITGLGTRAPTEPLHLDSLVAIKAGNAPLPGIPVYGPVTDLPAADYYRFASDEFAPDFGARPPMLRYGDVHSFVNTNEFSTWECMGPHAEHFAVLMLGP